MASILHISDNIETFTQKAILAAVSQNWLEAAKLNREILKIESNNVEAINRLARAQNCLGKINISQRLYKKALDIDPYNIIAKKNLEKISRSNGNGKQNGKRHFEKPQTQTSNVSSLFLYEPGKTKIISLLNLAPVQILATLNCGDEVLLNTKKHSAAITTLEKIYVGCLPDDLAHKLIAFIEGGNKYEAFIRCASIKNVTVFIKEAFRALKFTNQPSFNILQNPYLEV